MKHLLIFLVVCINQTLGYYIWGPPITNWKNYGGHWGLGAGFGGYGSLGGYSFGGYGGPYGPGYGGYKDGYGIFGFDGDMNTYKHVGYRGYYGGGYGDIGHNDHHVYVDSPAGYTDSNAIYADDSNVVYDRHYTGGHNSHVYDGNVGYERVYPTDTATGVTDTDTTTNGANDTSMTAFISAVSSNLQLLERLNEAGLTEQQAEIIFGVEDSSDDCRWFEGLACTASLTAAILVCLPTGPGVVQCVIGLIGPIAACVPCICWVLDKLGIPTPPDC